MGGRRLTAALLLVLLIGCAGPTREEGSAESGDLGVSRVTAVSQQSGVESAPRPVTEPTLGRPAETPTSPPAVDEAPATANQELSVEERVPDADVEFVRAVRGSAGTWTFHVTVRHPDTGWEDYADGWDVVAPDGTVLKRDEDDPFTRLLLHPHESEQPFTRSQSGLVVPDGVTQVTVRAHDLVDGYGGQEVIVDLTRNSGPSFEVDK